MRGRDRVHPGALVWLAPAVCAAVAASLLAYALLEGRSGPVVRNPAAGGEAVAGTDAPVRVPDEEREAIGSDGGDDEAGEEGAALPDGGPSDTGDSFPTGVLSPETFLSELDRLSSFQKGSETDQVSVEFEVESGLVSTGSAVMRAYRDAPGTELLSYGYLDIKGNAWGAIVQGAREWVDVVVIQALDGDEASIVRVARLLAPREAP